MRKSLSVLGAGMLLLAAMPAHAQRGESSVPGRLAVRDACPMSDLATVATEEQQQAEAFFLAPILAALGGELAKSALGGIASAIEAASQEHAYTASGADGFFIGGVDRAPNTGPWRLERKAQCLVFWVPDDATDAGKLAQFVQEAVAANLVSREAAEDLVTSTLPRAGISRPPLAYAEIALVPLAEAQIVRPLLVWYRKPIASAGRASRRAEMTVALASPGYSKEGDEMGSIFALSRIQLPRIGPNQVLRRDDLAGLATIYHPHRPTTGVVDDAVSGRNTVDAAVVTATVQQTAARRTYEAAKLKSDASNKPEDRAATLVAQHALEDATAALAAATSRVSALKPALHIGTTNARVSLVVIRDANKFGLAIAKALGAQQQALGTAVTQALTPQADWQANDTAMLTAMLDVQTKQAAYDAAVVEGDAAKVLAARNALLIAKAKANEAAVAINRPLPYPDLLAQAGS